MARPTLALADPADDDQLCEAIDAAGPDEAAAVLRLVTHPSADVRHAVACILPHLTDDDPGAELVAAGIALSGDPVPRVRDWACFALGQQWRDVDTPAVREALAARLDDIDVDTRFEALAGLAYRRDARALPRVEKELSRADGNVFRLAMIAAGALGDPALHDLALRHRTGWDSPENDRTADAVCRLTDPLGPGEDLLQGVAAMVRRRSRDRDPGRQLVWWHLFLELCAIAPHRTDDLYDAVLVRLSGDEQASRYLEALR